MSRPYSWYPLASSDPVPGDPVAVSRAGSEYTTVADAIETAGRRLSEIASLDTMTSEGVAAVRDRATDVAESVAKAHDRYVAVGTSLSTYAGQLSRAQDQSVTALARAQAAQHTIDHATAQITSNYRALNDATEPEEQSAYQTRVDAARRDRNAGDAALARARAELDEATSLRDQAARQAIDAIDGVTDSDGLNDGWWENWGSKVAHAVSEIAGAIAAVAGILSLALCWVPVLGEALAAVALIATAVALVADIVLAFAGEGTWQKVIFDALSLASFGVGKVIGAALKVTARGAAGSARLAAGSAAAISPATRAAGGLSEASSAMRALDEMLPEALSGLSRGTARGMVSGSNRLFTAQGLRDVFGVLKPGAVINDLFGSVGAAFTRSPGAYASWGEAFSAGGTQLVNALHASPQAFLAALAGEPAAAADLVNLSGVAPELLDFSSKYAHAVTVSNVAVGAATTINGVESLDSAHSAFEWVSDMFTPSAAATLNLG